MCFVHKREGTVAKGKAGQGELVLRVSSTVSGCVSFAKLFRLPQPHLISTVVGVKCIRSC